MDNISYLHGNKSVEITIQKKLLEIALQINNSIVATFFSLSLKDLGMATALRSSNKVLLQSCNQISDICIKTLAVMASSDMSLQVNPKNERIFFSSIKITGLFEHLLDMSNKICMQVHNINQEVIIIYVPLLEKLANTLSLMLKCLVDAYIQQDQEIAKSVSNLYRKYYVALPQINWNKETSNAIQNTIKLLCNYSV